MSDYWMERLFFLLFLVVGCNGSASYSSDAGRDMVALDQAHPDHSLSDTRVPDVFVVMDADVELPEVEPEQLRCVDIETADGRACIEDGWFSLAQWSPLYLGDDPSASPDTPHVSRPVYLEAFELDVYEVTNNQYYEWIQESERPVPSCGEGVVWYVWHEGLDSVPMLVPWMDGRPDLVYENAPVLCVSLYEAKDYCAAIGGRLPSPYEWFKAGSPEYPEQFRYPWGNTHHSWRIGGVWLPGRIVSILRLLSPCQSAASTI